MKKKTKGKSPKDLKEIIQLIKSGKDHDQIAMIYNVKKQTVRNWVYELRKTGHNVPKVIKGRLINSKKLTNKKDVIKLWQGKNEAIKKLVSKGEDINNAKKIAEQVEKYLKELTK